VFKNLFQDLEKLQLEVDHGYVLNLIISILQYISVRLKLLEFYDKLYEIGSSDSFIDFSELVEVIEIIQHEINDPSPVNEILKILE